MLCVFQAHLLCDQSAPSICLGTSCCLLASLMPCGERDDELLVPVSSATSDDCYHKLSLDIISLSDCSIVAHLSFPYVESVPCSQCFDAFHFYCSLLEKEDQSCLHYSRYWHSVGIYRDITMFYLVFFSTLYYFSSNLYCLFYCLPFSRSERSKYAYSNVWQEKV